LCFRQKNYKYVEIKEQLSECQQSRSSSRRTVSCHKSLAYTCNSRANWSMFYIRAIDCRNSLHVRFTLYVEHAWRQSLAACKCGCENSSSFRRNAVSRVTQVKIKLRTHSRTLTVPTIYQLVCSLSWLNLCVN